MTSIIKDLSLIQEFQKDLSLIQDILDPKPDPTWQDGYEAPPEPKKPPTPLTKAEIAAKAERQIAKATKTGVQELLEVDYEKNCTELYKKIESAIEEREWEPIVKFLDTGYWPGSLFAAEVSPKQQTMIWVTRFDPKDNTSVRWSQLPLHLAIVCGAPFSVIGRLIELYPEAVRCTDDQRMLPIHLALRYGATDDTIAYLLMQFPESVNAKGKDGRTPVQCALRAESKVRGKILEIFTTRIKTKSSEKDKEIVLLRSQLEAKSLALQHALSKFTMLSAVKEEIEDGYSKQISEAEKSKATVEKETSDQIEKLNDQKLVQELVLRQKISDLEKDKKAKEDAERKARDEQAAVRKQLETVSSAIAAASSPKHLANLKQEVKNIQEGHLDNDKQSLNEQMIALRSQLSGLSGKGSKEVMSMKKAAEKISASAKSAKTSSDVSSLRSKAESLEKQILERKEATKTVSELITLRLAIEADLKNSNGKSTEERVRLQRALDSMNGLENKSSTELTTIKREVEGIRNESKKRELVLKTQKDLETLKEALENRLKEDDSRQSLVKAMTAVDEIETELVDGKTTDQLLALKNKVDSHKERMKKKELVSTLRLEIQGLKDFLETECRKPANKTRHEISEMKKAVRSAKTLSTKNVNELTAVKDSLEVLKLKIDIKSEAATTEKDLALMKKSLEEHEKQWDGKNKSIIDSTKKTINEVSARYSKLSTDADIGALRTEMKALREDVGLITKATRVKQDLRSLKDLLEAAVTGQEDKNASELLAAKKAVDSISVAELNIKEKHQWEMIEIELAALREELKAKNSIPTEEVRTQAPVKEGKKKKGWRKLFSGSRAKSVHSTAVEEESPDGVVHTILPPSVAPETESEAMSSVAAPPTFKSEDQPVLDEISKAMSGSKSVQSISSRKSGRSRKSGSRSFASAVDPQTGGVELKPVVSPE